MVSPGVRSCTAFSGAHILATGQPAAVALAVKAALAVDPATPVLVFDDTSGAVIDLDLRGTDEEIVARLAAPGAADAEAPTRTRGRPKLGVVAREVTLLPRHWEWLSAQPGGASQALRRLVDEARRADGGRSAARMAQEAAYRFMSAMAGDFPGFEDASRALFAGDRSALAERLRPWPADISAYAQRLAWSDDASRPSDGPTAAGSASTTVPPPARRT
ncbi:MAG: DUF2239 family protein [Proteobacteria bacterium]|nr:DUF2239 family protein [Pseudomonadota bacterium]